ncbi:MAG: sigma-70 family RNA polymerase sigma factor [Pirellulales bacterium]
MDEKNDPHRLVEACIKRLASGDLSARDELINLAGGRMQKLAHRMLVTFPAVRRWEQTDDVVQNAAVRLWKALGQVVPRDARHFMGLTAIQIRRELLDLAKKHAAAGAYAANHETNYQRCGDDMLARVDLVPDATQAPDVVARWSQLHEAAADLPDEERELFHLVWYLGLTQEEASNVLGCSTRTVKRRWESAKALLAQALPANPLQ